MPLFFRSEPAVLTREAFWEKYDALEARLSAPLSERMIALAGLRSGMRVLDLATGRGEPALRAAHRVGPTGEVLGVDSSPSMLAMAAKRAAREGLTNLELRATDATAIDNLPVHHFDAVLSRWGITFMGAPIAALQRACRALKPEGTAVFAVWAEPERSDWFSLPRRVLEDFRETGLSAPAAFRYSDEELMRGDLDQAGFKIAHVEELHVPIVEAQDPSEIVAWTRALGMDVLLEALPDTMQQAWERDFIRELEARRQDGVIQLGGITRLVTCKRGTRNIRLRPYVESDLPILFEHQRDPEAIRIGAIPSRNWEAFSQHVAKILADTTGVYRVILFDGETVGSSVTFQRGGHSLIGYSLGRKYWGQGIATEAVRQLLSLVKDRPLYAEVSKGNIASRRVLEKNGFTVVSEREGEPDAEGRPVTEVVLKLEGGADVP